MRSGDGQPLRRTKFRDLFRTHSRHLVACQRGDLRTTQGLQAGVRHDRQISGFHRHQLDGGQGSEVRSAQPSNLGQAERNDLIRCERGELD